MDAARAGVRRPGRDLLAPLRVPGGHPARPSAVQELVRRDRHRRCLRTAVPATPQDVVTIANWARANGYRVRARGMSHNWSPVLQPKGSSVAKVVSSSTSPRTSPRSPSTPGTRPPSPPRPGATVDKLLTTLEASGRGLIADHRAPAR
ncbi:hypothetical protein ACU686_26880 [Yinghuangia aomiensis]